MKSLKLCTSIPEKHCPIIFLPYLLHPAKFTTALPDLTLIIPYIFLNSLRPVVKRSIKFQGTKIWNSIPIELQNQSFYKFKSNFKSFLLQLYC